MKKHATLKLILLMTVIFLAYGFLALGIITAATFSDWKVFNDQSTESYTQANPYETIIFLNPVNDAGFTAESLSAWKADMERVIALNAGQTEVPQIVAYDCDFTFLENEDVQAYPVLVTFANLPAVVVDKKVTPFEIEYTQTLLNPLSLLPGSSDFDYAIMYTFERRHSYVNTEIMTTDEIDSYYAYLWTNTDPIIIKDLYPNRLLPYILILLAAPAYGGVIYLAARYNDCKKAENPLQ